MTESMAELADKAVNLREWFLHHTRWKERTNSGELSSDIHLCGVAHDN